MALGRHGPHATQICQAGTAAFSRAFVTSAGGEKGASFLLQTLPALQISGEIKNKKPNTPVSVFIILGQSLSFGGEGN